MKEQGLLPSKTDHDLVEVLQAAGLLHRPLVLAHPFVLLCSCTNSITTIGVSEGPADFSSNISLVYFQAGILLHFAFQAPQLTCVFTDFTL